MSWLTPTHCTNRKPAPPPPFAIEPIPLTLIDAPLDYLGPSTFASALFCGALKRFARAGHAPRAEADRVTAFLDRDLPLHHEDEDEDLFPRCAAARSLRTIWGLFSRGSRTTIVSPTAWSPTSRRRSRPHQPRPVRLDQDARRRFMQAFAASEHRHLAMENGIVMALARVRLKHSDLKMMSRQMRLRRGLTPDVAHARSSLRPKRRLGRCEDPQRSAVFPPHGGAADTALSLDRLFGQPHHSERCARLDPGEVFVHRNIANVVTPAT